MDEVEDAVADLEKRLQKREDGKFATLIEEVEYIEKKKQLDLYKELERAKYYMNNWRSEKQVAQQKLNKYKKVYEEVEEHRNQLQTENTALRKQVTALGADVNRLREANTGLGKHAKELQSQVERLKEENGNLQQQVGNTKNLQQQIGRLKEENGILQQQVARLKKEDHALEKRLKKATKHADKDMHEYVDHLKKDDEKHRKTARKERKRMQEELDELRDQYEYLHRQFWKTRDERFKQKMEENSSRQTKLHEGLQKMDSCVSCGDLAAKLECAPCGTRYCGTTCQRVDWPNHSKACASKTEK